MENKATVLVVDDDHVSLTLLKKLVEKLGYTVLPAQSGQEAIGILKTRNVELIIADYEMPEMNGLELLKQAKALHTKTPYILVTAHSNISVIREAWENGAFDFFQKPVFVDRLNQTIRLAIEYGHLSIARRRFTKLEEQNPEPDLLNIGVVRELAVAIERDDLLKLVEEFETNARIELEQVFRYNAAKEHVQTKAIAHRLAGTAINLGLVKFSDALREVEKKPEAPITRAMELEQTLERSIYWLKTYLVQIFQNIAI